MTSWAGGKGCARRPLAISEAEFANSWDKIFNGERDCEERTGGLQAGEWSPTEEGGLPEDRQESSE